MRLPSSVPPDAKPYNHDNTLHDPGKLLATPWRDARRVHLLTRGNVDGITSAGLVLARWPDARVRFVTNATVATAEIRKDIGSDRFLLVDLGLEAGLVKTLNRRAHDGTRIALLDHHQQSIEGAGQLDERIDRHVLAGISAASVAREWLGVDGLEHLAAIADVVEYCAGPDLQTVRDAVGDQRLLEESRLLDFSWRLNVSDDRFRMHVARRLAAGAWPSEIPQVVARDLQMRNERRWERALERIRQHVRFEDDVAILSFSRRKPSLFGFGSRALTTVAAEAGCRVALLIHRRGGVASVGARRLTHSMGDLTYDDVFQPRPPQKHTNINLGRFLTEFTDTHGFVGGGHPESAGGKIPSRLLSTFVEEMACFV